MKNFFLLIIMLVSLVYKAQDTVSVSASCKQYKAIKNNSFVFWKLLMRDKIKIISYNGKAFSYSKKIQDSIIDNSILTPIHLRLINRKNNYYILTNVFGEYGFSNVIEYYSSGKIKSSGNYLNNEKDSLWICYYPNGMKESEGNYTKGKKAGLWKYYDNKGNLKKEKIY